MTPEKFNKKVEKLRKLTEAKMKFLRDHGKLLDQAFEELKFNTEEELDIIEEKIANLDQRMKMNGI